MSVVIQIQAVHAPSNCDTELARTKVQLAALTDHIVGEALFLWLGNQETSPTDEQIATERDRLHHHYTRIALAATEGRRTQP